MMKRKFGTVLASQTIAELKVVAAREGKKLTDVIEEALSQYLSTKRRSVVEETRGGLKAPANLVRAVLDEEDTDDA